MANISLFLQAQLQNVHGILNMYSDIAALAIVMSLAYVLFIVPYTACSSFTSLFTSLLMQVPIPQHGYIGSTHQLFHGYGIALSTRADR